MLVVSWVISGAIFGSGVAMIASALSSGQRGDDFQSGLLFLAATTLIGAVLGGLLANRTRQSVTDKVRLAALALLLRLIWKTGGP